MQSKCIISIFDDSDFDKNTWRLFKLNPKVRVLDVCNIVTDTTNEHDGFMYLVEGPAYWVRSLSKRIERNQMKRGGFSVATIAVKDDVIIPESLSR